MGAKAEFERFAAEQLADLRATEFDRLADLDGTRTEWGRGGWVHVWVREVDRSTLSVVLTGGLPVVPQWPSLHRPYLSGFRKSRGGAVTEATEEDFALHT